MLTIFGCGPPSSLLDSDLGGDADLRPRISDPFLQPVEPDELLFRALHIYETLLCLEQELLGLDAAIFSHPPLFPVSLLLGLLLCRERRGLGRRLQRLRVPQGTEYATRSEIRGFRLEETLQGDVVCGENHAVLLEKFIDPPLLPEARLHQVLPRLVEVKKLPFRRNGITAAPLIPELGII